MQDFQSISNMKILLVVFIVQLTNCHPKNSSDFKNLDNSCDKSEKKNDGATTYGNIFFFHHAGSQSHLNFIRPLVEGLADHGHNVTIAQYSAANFNHENITEILIKDR